LAQKSIFVEENESDTQKHGNRLLAREHTLQLLTNNAKEYPQ